MKVSELMEKMKSMKPDDDIDFQQPQPEPDPPAPPPQPEEPSVKAQPIVFTDDQFKKLTEMVAKSLQNSRIKMEENDDDEIYI